VRDGTFASAVVPGTSLDELLGAALDAPGTRSALLEPKWELVALGAVRGPDSTGLLVTTWEPYKNTDPAAVQKVVFEALKKERQRRGFKGLGEVGMESAVAAANAKLAAGNDANQVVKTLLNETVNAMQRDFRAWTLETSDPQNIPWPPELLTPKETYVAVAAGTSLKKGSPWATTTVVIVAHISTDIVAANDDAHDVVTDAVVAAAR
jgi:hypothetical protein